MTTELETKIYRSQQNPMRVLPCVQLNEEGIATGIKEQFDWIFDEDTECGEWIHGTNVKVITTVPDSRNRFLIHQIQTRRNVSGEINFFTQPNLVEAIAEANNNGWLSFPRTEPSIVGTVWTGENGYGDPEDFFVSRHEQFTKYGFSEWQRGWETEESKAAREQGTQDVRVFERPTRENGFAAIQLWMLTTLSSGIDSTDDDITDNTSRLILKARPNFPQGRFIDGLFFRNQRLGTYARVPIAALEFYQLYLKTSRLKDNVTRDERNKLGIRLKEVIQELNSNVC